MALAIQCVYCGKALLDAEHARNHVVTQCAESPTKKLADALETFVRDSDVSLESLERTAEEFRRETGYLAPGKDEAAAVNSAVTAEQRRAAWNEWSGKRIRARIEVARAALRAVKRIP